MRERDRAHVLKRFDGAKASFLVQLNTIIGLEPTDMVKKAAGGERSAVFSGDLRTARRQGGDGTARSGKRFVKPELNNAQSSLTNFVLDGPS